MAVTNFTDEENQKNVRELYCSAEFTERLHSELIFLAAVNISLSITAFLGNFLILVALQKETSLHPPSKLLYRNLAITDLCVGIVAEPLYAAYLISVVNERWMICYYTDLLRVFSAFVFSIFIYIDCNKRRQTTRLVAAAQIQTSCNFKKNNCICSWFLVFVHCWFIYFLLECSYAQVVSIHRYSSESNHRTLLLHQNLLHLAS